MQSHGTATLRRSGGRGPHLPRSSPRRARPLWLLPRGRPSGLVHVASRLLSALLEPRSVSREPMLPRRRLPFAFLEGGLVCSLGDRAAVTGATGIRFPGCSRAGV